MAPGSKIDDSEITATNNLFSDVVTLTSPPLPTLPVDVILEILCRLPAKLLLQLRSVCKWWNFLISDSKFIKKHLRMSTTRRRLHFLRYLSRPQNKYILTSYPLDSVFTNLNTDLTEFEYSPNNFKGDYPRTTFEHFIGSCNGILCFADHYKGLVILWNPSIRKFKDLPLFTKPDVCIDFHMTFGFGYDSSTDQYKVVVVLDYLVPVSTTIWVLETEVKVHILGTNIWRSIPTYPFGGVPVPSALSGKYVSGTMNWLVSKDPLGWGKPCYILSFDLVNESYQMILPHIDGEDMCDLWSIGVLRDCLCVTSGNDVWIMEEYGNKESWTKLFTVPYMRVRDNSHVLITPIYMFDDDQVILKFNSDNDLDLALYDSKSDTLKLTDFHPIDYQTIPEVCIESLISP
ncbi:F-box/kelch-repeat protein At3g23880-like [Trifolium pratense]|uniref:F-box/kelch-repeat protein At3g23880-like n=1 Tax=Trifolium pratense TaxID=57577 RepID=UPI001E6938E1|nr:F-box/kelch-repeat protein At3g23880-like [Trifolium pratense]